MFNSSSDCTCTQSLPSMVPGLLAHRHDPFLRRADLVRLAGACWSTIIRHGAVLAVEFCAFGKQVNIAFFQILICRLVGNRIDRVGQNAPNDKPCELLASLRDTTVLQKTLVGFAEEICLHKHGEDRLDQLKFLRNGFELTGFFRFTVYFLNCGRFRLLSEKSSFAYTSALSVASSPKCMAIYWQYSSICFSMLSPLPANLNLREQMTYCFVWDLFFFFYEKGLYFAYRMCSIRKQLHPPVCDGLRRKNRGFRTLNDTVLRVCSLPISFQDPTFEMYPTLFQCFDRMELSPLCQVNDILLGVTLYLRRFRRINDSVCGKVPKVLHCQRNTFANPVEYRIRNAHVHVPSNTYLPVCIYTC